LRVREIPKKIPVALSAAVLVATFLHSICAHAATLYVKTIADPSVSEDQ